MRVFRVEPKQTEVREQADLQILMDSSTVASFNVSDDSISQEYDNTTFSWFVILSLLTLAMIIADIYMIVIISKFKSLRTYQNLLIVKAIWFHLGYIMLGEILLILVVVLSTRVSGEGNCFLRNLDSLCLSMVYFLMTFLAADWFIAQYHPNFHQKHLKLFTKKGLYFCYLLVMPETLVTSVFCFVDPRSTDLVAFIFKTVTFVLCLSAVTIMFILKRRRPLPLDSRKYEYCFNISFVFLLMSLPMNIYDEHYSFIDHMISRTVLMFLSHVGYVLYTLAPIVMVFLLAQSNKHFKVAYMRCCQKKSAKSYGDNINDVESLEQDQDGGVSFNRGSNSVQLDN